MKGIKLYQLLILAVMAVSLMSGQASAQLTYYFGSDTMFNEPMWGGVAPDGTWATATFVDVDTDHVGRFGRAEELLIVFADPFPVEEDQVEGPLGRDPVRGRERVDHLFNRSGMVRQVPRLLDHLDPHRFSSGYSIRA